VDNYKVFKEDHVPRTEFGNVTKLRDGLNINIVANCFCLF